MEKGEGKRRGGMGRRKGMGEGGKIEEPKIHEQNCIIIIVALHLVTGTVHTVSYCAC